MVIDPVGNLLSTTINISCRIFYSSLNQMKLTNSKFKPDFCKGLMFFFLKQMTINIFIETW